MRLSKVVSAAMIVGALGFGALGPGGAVASADPGARTAEAARQFLPALVRRRQRPR